MGTEIQTVNHLQGTVLAKVVQYARNEKSYLYAFLEDPQIPIDNNLAERAVKPFVIGRKNWLFSTSPKGAERQCYSLFNHQLIPHRQTALMPKSI